MKYNDISGMTVKEIENLLVDHKVEVEPMSGKVRRKRYNKNVRKLRKKRRKISARSRKYNRK